MPQDTTTPQSAAEFVKSLSGKSWFEREKAIRNIPVTEVNSTTETTQQKNSRLLNYSLIGVGVVIVLVIVIFWMKSRRK